MLSYELFRRMFAEAEDYTDLELFIGERGWQEWMQPFFNENDRDMNKVVLILEEIYKLSKMTIKEMRETAYRSRADFARNTFPPIRLGGGKMAPQTLWIITKN